MQLFRKLSFSFLIFNLLLHIGSPFKSASTFNDTEVEDCMMGLKFSDMLKLTHSLERIAEEGSFEDDFSKGKGENHIGKVAEKVNENQSEKKEDSLPFGQNCMKPMAMALTGRSFYDSSEHHHQHSYHPWKPQKDDKQTKLTTLFNISITALAFISFGGYLICLVVHAIKSKGTTFLLPMTTEATTVDDDGTRIKIYRPGRRSLLERISKPNYDG